MTVSRIRLCGVITYMDRNTEDALIGRLRTGDPAAFDAIYAEFHPRLYRFLYRMTKNRAVAEDLVEETWLRLVGAAAKLADGTRAGPWLFTVARNLFLSYCRSRAREQAYTADLYLLWPEAPPSPYAEAAAAEFADRLEAALQALPPAYREVVLLVGVEGMRPSEAAEVCGISGEALRQRLSRARKLLAQHLEVAAGGVYKEVSL